MTFNQKNGFSLVELAIVIVIIGLLIAGITAGSNMVKQSEVRAVIAEADEMKVQYNTFFDIYGAVPGDFSSATAFFTSCAETASNCNGNGDGNISWAAGVTDEVYKAMLHMSRAEITRNNIANLPDAHGGSIQNGVISGKRTGSGLFYGGFGGVTIAGGYNPHFTNNVAIYIGNYDGTFGYVNGAFDADEAFLMDQKIDDGAINGTAFLGFDTGKFRANDDGSGANNCLNVGDTAYNVGNTSSCVISFQVN